MIQNEDCRRCGRPLLKVPLGGISIKADPGMLDAQQAVDGLLEGRELYRVTYLAGRPYSLKPATAPVLSALATAEPSSETEFRTPWGERPHVVREHRCPPGSPVAPSKAPDVRMVAPCPADAQTGVQGASRAPFGLPAPDGRASDGANHPSEGSSIPLAAFRAPRVPRSACHRCRRLQRAPEGLAVRPGEAWVWKQHAERHP